MPGARILLVDDEPDVVAVVSELLQRQGHAVTGAHSAAEGLALLDSGTFDAIITDIELPDMSGLRAIEEFARRSKAPILVITGHADSELEKDAKLLGARAFLAKPLDPERLKEALSELLS